MKVFLLIIVFLLFAFALFVIYRELVQISGMLRSRRANTRQPNIENSLKNLSDKIEAHDKLLMNSIQTINRSISSLNEAVRRLEQIEDNKKRNSVQPPSSPSMNQPIPRVEPVKRTMEAPLPSHKYVRPYKGDILIECDTKEEAVYELTLCGTNEATFRFCGNQGKALSNIDSYIKPYCEFERTNVDQGHLSTVKEGRIVLETNGAWKLLVKATIKFE